MSDIGPFGVALFPWLACGEPIEVGDIRLVPYERGRLPGDTSHARQMDIDAIVAAYSERPNELVSQASLLEIADWHTGRNVEEHAPRLLEASALITFAALSKRRLFGRHFGYCNSHAYLLVVHRYLPGSAGHFGFETRRRDGTTHHIWSSERFAFLRPHHVAAKSKCDLDRDLLAALLKLGKESPVREAVREFNAANTDSDDVPEHVEVVMVKSAFEWLLGIGWGTQKFVDALTAAVLPALSTTPCNGPMLDRWHKRWPKAKRPIEAWARDFCDVRGAAAHGKGPADRFVWQAGAHLAFASILFPLLVKKRLADDTLFSLSDVDRALLQDIERLLMIDPFSPESRAALADGNAHPWAQIQSEASFDAIARRLFQRGD